MAFKLPTLNIKGTNIKEGTSFKAPSSSGNIKKEMDWKYGHGEFADIKKRRKPGESKFDYNVRMRKEGRKVKQREPGVLEREIADTSDLTRGQRLALGEKLYPETNPNDKRKKVGDYFTFSGGPGDEFKYRYLDIADEDLPLQERFEFQRPGSDVWETSKTYEGAEAIHNLFIRDDISAEITPIQKRKK